MPSRIAIFPDVSPFRRETAFATAALATLLLRR